MWITALVIGFAGSFHCLGMCSPLVMAVTSIRTPFFGNRLLYNAGRIFTYAILGSILSAFGSVLHISGFQNILSAVLGGALILVGVAGITHLNVPLLTPALQYFTARLKRMFSLFLSSNTIGSIAFLGMLNGLLPCGLTYLALSYCLTLADATSGFLFMLTFGVGTLPVMLGFTSVIQMVMNRFQFSLRRVNMVVMIALGALLITRSFYVSAHWQDRLTAGEQPVVVCQ